MWPLLSLTLVLHAKNKIKIENKIEEKEMKWNKTKSTFCDLDSWSVSNTYLTVDFITKLPLVARKDVILVVYNRLSKITHFVATAERMTSEGLARLFRDNVWKLHELPESVVLDKGLQFAAKLTKELNWMLGIKTKLSTAFHPQTNS